MSVIRGRMCDRCSNNRFSHLPALFTVRRISRILQRSIKRKFYNFVNAVLILNNQLHGDAFLVASDIMIL